MKNYAIIIGITIFCGLPYKAQVGINTSSPATGTVLHIDAGKDNTSTSVTQAVKDGNDVVVTTTGSMGIGTTAPDASAAFEIKSTERGILIPRMTTSQRDQISPTGLQSGLTIFNTSVGCLQTYVSSRVTDKWRCNNATVDGLTPNISVSTFTFNNDDGGNNSEVCVGTICARHTGAPTGAYLEFKSNYHPTEGSNIVANLPFSSVAIYKLTTGGMNIDNTNLGNAAGTNRPLVTFLTNYPSRPSDYKNSTISNNPYSNTAPERKLIFINGRVNVNDVAIYQINDGTTGSNYRVTFTMVQTSTSGSASTAGNSKYLINIERMSNGTFYGGFKATDPGMPMTPP